MLQQLSDMMQKYCAWEDADVFVGWIYEGEVLSRLDKILEKTLNCGDLAFQLSIIMLLSGELMCTKHKVVLSGLEVILEHDSERNLCTCQEQKSTLQTLAGFTSIYVNIHGPLSYNNSECINSSWK